MPLTHAMSSVYATQSGRRTASFLIVLLTTLPTQASDKHGTYEQMPHSIMVYVAPISREPNLEVSLSVLSGQIMYSRRGGGELNTQVLPGTRSIIGTILRP